MIRRRRWRGRLGEGRGRDEEEAGGERGEGGGAIVEIVGDKKVRMEEVVMKEEK